MMSATSTPVENSTQSEEGEIDLAGIIASLKRRRKTLLLFALAPAVLTLAVTLLMKPTFTAEATFLPPNSMSSGGSILPTALLGQLGGAGSSLAGLKDPTLIYIGVLGSRAVADNIIKKFDLAEVYHTKKLSSTEKALARHTKVSSAKSTITTISVDDHDPKRAADLANAYLEQLHIQNSRLALTEASQRRLFFQQQVENEKNALAEAEVAMAQSQQKTGLIQPVPQAQLQMETIAQTQARISAREVELAAISQGATEQNPEVVRVRSEIAGLRDQLSKLEDSNERGGAGNIQVPTSKVPELTLIYLRKARDVKYHEELYQLLLRQYVSAQLDESRSAPLLQVVDYATVPDTKSGPHRGLLTMAALVLGTIAGFAWILLRDKKAPIA
ncbi:MAG: lipopolysaccharide biosynthesis protein [Acidobacteria bacterium]|nr:lipopolysaccharide biosynthesis protein [Acidobacteriota bacterium]